MPLIFVEKLACGKLRRDSLLAAFYALIRKQYFNFITTISCKYLKLSEVWGVSNKNITGLI